MAITVAKEVETIIMMIIAMVTVLNISIIIVTPMLPMFPMAFQLTKVALKVHLILLRQVQKERRVNTDVLISAKRCMDQNAF
jgi:hypothetical protein